MRTKSCVKIVIAMIVAVWTGGCALPEKGPEPVTAPVLVEIETAEYPEFFDDMKFDGLAHGIAKSLHYLNRVPASRTFTFGRDTYPAAHMIRSLERFARFAATEPSANGLKRFIADNYRVYRSAGAKDGGNVLFTGYYEPLLRGSREKKGDFRFPVYARPSDHLIVDLSRFSERFDGETIIGRINAGSLVPYYDRKSYRP